MKHKFIKNLVCLILVSISLLGFSSVSANAEWKQNSNGKWNYLLDNGSILKNTWLYDKNSNQWCHLDENGIRTTGWFQDKGNWYYLKDNGEMATNTTIDGYKIGSNGVWIQNNTINNTTSKVVNNTNNGIINNGGNNVNIINNYNNYGVINTNVNNNQENYSYNNQNNNNTIPSIKTASDLQNYLNKNYSSLNTPIGILDFNIIVRENDDNMFPYDFEINTDWGNIEDSKYNLDYFNPSDLNDSIKITDEDKESTKELLKKYQKNISEIAIKSFPDKKIKGGFYSGFYKYKYLRTGYGSVQFYSWKNYDLDLSSYKYYNEQYKHSTLSEFNWDTENDNYNLN